MALLCLLCLCSAVFLCVAAAQSDLTIAALLEKSKSDHSTLASTPPFVSQRSAWQGGLADWLSAGHLAEIAGLERNQEATMLPVNLEVVLVGFGNAVNLAPLSRAAPTPYRVVGDQHRPNGDTTAAFAVKVRAWMLGNDVAAALRLVAAKHSLPPGRGSGLRAVNALAMERHLESLDRAIRTEAKSSSGLDPLLPRRGVTLFVLNLDQDDDASRVLSEGYGYRGGPSKVSVAASAHNATLLAMLESSMELQLRRASIRARSSPWNEFSRHDEDADEGDAIAAEEEELAAEREAASGRLGQEPSAASVTRAGSEWAAKIIDDLERKDAAGDDYSDELDLDGIGRGAAEVRRLLRRVERSFDRVAAGVSATAKPIDEIEALLKSTTELVHAAHDLRASTKSSDGVVGRLTEITRADGCLTDTWVGGGRLAWLDLSAGPCSWGPTVGGEGVRIALSTPRLVPALLGGETNANDSLPPARLPQARAMLASQLGRLRGEKDVDEQLGERWGCRTESGKVRSRELDLESRDDCAALNERVGLLAEYILSVENVLAEEAQSAGGEDREEDVEAVVVALAARIDLDLEALRVEQWLRRLRAGGEGKTASAGYSNYIGPKAGLKIPPRVSELTSRIASAAETFLRQVVVPPSRIPLSGSTIVGRSGDTDGVLAPEALRSPLRFVIDVYLIDCGNAGGDEGQSQSTFDVDALHLAVGGIALPHQSVSFAVHRLKIDDDPALRVAFTNARRSVVTPSVDNQGHFITSRRWHLDSITLRNELRSLDDAQHKNRNGIHATNRYRTSTDVCVPVFVFTDVDDGPSSSPQMVDGAHYAVALEDMVIAIQPKIAFTSSSESGVALWDQSPVSCNGERVAWSLRTTPTRAAAAAVIELLGGAVRAHLSEPDPRTRTNGNSGPTMHSSTSQRPSGQDFLWAVGDTPLALMGGGGGGLGVRALGENSFSQLNWDSMHRSEVQRCIFASNQMMTAAHRMLSLVKTTPSNFDTAQSIVAATTNNGDPRENPLEVLRELRRLEGQVRRARNRAQRHVALLDFGAASKLLNPMLRKSRLYLHTAKRVSALLAGDAEDVVDCGDTDHWWSSPMIFVVAVVFPCALTIMRNRRNIIGVKSA